jgi:hypothetical protein
MALTETVTITRPVSQRIQDLVLFAKTLAGKDIKSMTDEELIKRANDFWEAQHGEE